MTLLEFFDWISRHPQFLLIWHGIIPLAALLIWQLGTGEGHLSPWRYFYATIIYATMIPAMLALSINLYLFLFERRSILDANIYIQVLPIVSGLLTLALVKQNVRFSQIPGFDRISGLAMMIFTTLAFMWVLDRTRIYIISVMPFWQGLIIFVALFAVIRYGWRRFSRSH